MILQPFRISNDLSRGGHEHIKVDGVFIPLYYFLIQKHRLAIGSNLTVNADFRTVTQKKKFHVTELCIVSFYSRIGYYVSSFQSIFTAEGVFHREAAKVIQSSFQNSPNQHPAPLLIFLM